VARNKLAWRESTDADGLTLRVQQHPSPGWNFVSVVSPSMVSMTYMFLLGARPSYLTFILASTALTSLSLLASGYFFKTVVRVESTTLTVSRTRFPRVSLRVPLIEISSFGVVDRGWSTATISAYLTGGRVMPLPLRLHAIGPHINQAEALVDRLHRALGEARTPKTYRG
jgi:hypothetical protein